MENVSKLYGEAIQPLTLNAEIEKLNSRVDALREQLKIYDERFSRLNEEIGELRSMLITKEQEIKEIEMKTIKAYETVMSISPENFLKKLGELEHKFEGLFQKAESADFVQNQVLKEFKEIKSAMMTFRGINDIIALNEDVKLELENIKKIEANIEKHSDKVEGIFIRLSKNLQEFEKIKELSENLTETFREIIKNLEALIETLGSSADNIEKSGQLENLKEQISKSSETIKKLEAYHRELDDLMKKTQEIKVKKDIEKEEKVKEEIHEELEEIKLEQEKIKTEERTVEKDMRNIKTLISKAMEDMKNKKCIEAQKKYLEINEIYNSLQPELKKKIYPIIKELYLKIKPKNKNFLAYGSSDVYDVY